MMLMSSLYMGSVKYLNLAIIYDLKLYFTSVYA